ncbi:MAG: histidine kinase dimerization/phospho-acceptor domain-containing protein, partial [Candidatus Omnitrophica bacterium]|nr:histidine kinase dimerization/phospho-acceptor domain-containing protein [Candidatus Omnitrophota bacterium]
MRLKVHYKITLLFSVITAAVLLFSYTHLKHSLREETYSRIREGLLRELSLSRSYMESFSGAPASLGQAQMAASSIAGNLGLRVTVITPEGKVIGDSDLGAGEVEDLENHLGRPEVQQALSGVTGESERYSTTVRSKMLYVASSYGIEGRSRGVIRLAMPLVAVEEVITRLDKSLVVSFLVAFLLLILAGGGAAYIISRPLRDISDSAKSLARGDFSRRLLVSSNDEIGDLARAFMHMSEEIRARMTEATAMRSKLEAVLMSMFDGVMVLGPSGEILLMNEPLKKLLMLQGAVEGKNPIEVIRNVGVKEIASRAMRLSGGMEAAQIKVILDGERDILVHATPLLRASRVEGAVLVFHDITELKRLENIRRDFVANVSHELRTPIASIKGYAETLSEGAISDAENAGEFLRIITDEADRLSSLVNDLLDLARIESSVTGPDKKPCDIVSCVDSAVKSLSGIVMDRSVDIKVSIPENIPRVSADRKMMTQVLYNLLDNAIKYNRPMGSILVSASVKGGDVEISVQDTGIGIPEKDLERIFERFYRVDKARSRE